MKKTTFYLPLLIIAIFMSSCTSGIFCTKGEGEKFTQERTVNNFNQIRLEIDANLHVKQSDTASITIVAQENILNEIEMTVQNGEIEISYDHCVTNHNGVDIYISTSDIDRITMNGSGEIIIEKRFETEELDLIINASGDINFSNISVSKQLNTQINGSGNVTLASQDTTQLHNIDIAGSGNIEAYELLTNETKVEITGSGNIYIWAIEKLAVSIIGSGNVYYKGDPSVSIDVSGSGTVIDSN